MIRALRPFCGTALQRCPAPQTKANFGFISKLFSRRFSTSTESANTERTLLKTVKKVPNWRKRNLSAEEGRLTRHNRGQDVEETTAYHTSESYDISSLYSYLARKSTNIKLSEELEGSSSVISRKHKGGDVFYFQGGSIVCWGLSVSESTELLKELKQFEKRPIENLQTESMDYILNQNNSYIRDDVIHLQRSNNEERGQEEKLAFSYGLHQSVKLAFIEDKISAQIRSTLNIQEHLVNKRGWLHDKSTSKGVNQMLSDLLTIRANLNLHSELIGTPDIFWEHPELEIFFQQITNNLEIGQRMDIVNTRLDEILVMLKMLKSELATDHDVHLTVLIIVLIAAEILIHITPHVIHWFT